MLINSGKVSSWSIKLKRNEALPDHQGIGLAVLDGHGSHASYRRHCAGCLQRTIHSEHGDRLQHYHRQVTLMLLPAAAPGRPALRLLLDQEPQRPGEDEVQTAFRLLRRVTHGRSTWCWPMHCMRWLPFLTSC